MNTLAQQLLAFVVGLVVLAVCVLIIRLVLPMLGLPHPLELVFYLLLALFVFLAIIRHLGWLNWSPSP